MLQRGRLLLKIIEFTIHSKTKIKSLSSSILLLAAAAGAGGRPKKRSKTADASLSACLAASSSSGLQLPTLPLLQRFTRPPMRYDPEAILGASGLEALGVTSFLHENYLHFAAEDAIDDAAEAAKYV